MSLRTLQAFALEKLVDQTTLTVTVKDEDAAFQWVKEWFLEQEFLKRIRRVDLDTTMRGTELALLPAPGIHLFWRRGRPFWVWFHRSDETKGRAQRQMGVAYLLDNQRWLKVHSFERTYAGGGQG